MDGILIVNKPHGWTSFDVVAKVRNLSHTQKVGHSGTLDPIATGVLAVFLGSATKQIKYFLEGDKGYVAEMVLGVKTDTGDSTGKILTPDPSPSKMERGEELNENRVRSAFAKYTGEMPQVPPMFSAVKVRGKKLYELARKGIEIDRKPRKITIYRNEIIEINFPVIRFMVFCSKGTYIRQLVMDIGDDLGCGAHLIKIERIYSHPFHISAAANMETIVNLAKIGKLHGALIPVKDVIGA